MDIKTLISKENLKSILDQFINSIYKKIDKKIEEDLSGSMKKEDYDKDKDGIIDKSKIAENIEDINKDKLLELLNVISKTNPQQYIGTNLENKLGVFYFPINQETHNSIEQKVTLGVKKDQIITIESVADMQDQKAFVQVYKYVEGVDNVINTIKQFDNKCADNFIYSDNIEFDDSCHIKNKYTYNTTLKDGIYETDIINKDEFLQIDSIDLS